LSIFWNPFLEQAGIKRWCAAEQNVGSSRGVVAVIKELAATGAGAGEIRAPDAANAG